MGKAHDDKIKVLLAKVEEQQGSLGTKPKAERITNGIFKFQDEDADFFNLNTVKDPQVLVNALATILTRKSAADDAAKLLGVKMKSSFTWGGFTVEDWTKDFKNRIATLQYEERKAQLDATKKKLKDLRSEDLKTGDALDELEKLI